MGKKPKASRASGLRAGCLELPCQLVLPCTSFPPPLSSLHIRAGRLIGSVVVQESYEKVATWICGGSKQV